MSSIDFHGDWSAPEHHRYLQELAQGRLPGKWGVMQDVVGHWAISKDDQGWLRYGKAALDTLGTLLSFHTSQRQVVEGNKNPTRLWLEDNGYQEVLPGAGAGLRSFICGSLADLEFTDQKVRNTLGELDQAVLKRFEIAPGKLAFFLNQWTDVKSSRARTSWWEGPFCAPEDRPLFKRFLRDHVWDVLGTRTLLLAPDTSRSKLEQEGIQLSAVSDEFDFISAKDSWNDIEALAGRCNAFLNKGRSRTLLFYGPPGTGKSTVARAIARELGVTLVLMSYDAVAKMSDSTVVRILSMLEPGVVVLNDIDRAPGREHTALLQGLEHHNERPLLTILTVNDVHLLDPALLRPGRVHEVREVPEPSNESRDMILRYFAIKLGLEVSDAQVEAFMERSEGFSPADVKEFCETAHAVGVPMAIEELDRIERQRKLYAGDNCKQFNDRVGRRGRRRRGGYAHNG